MALDSLYFTGEALDQYFVDKDSGKPLSGGTLEFYRDSARSTPKQVYELTGNPPNYTYTSLGTTLTLSESGTVVNASNNPTVIQYKPFDANGNLDLYYIVCKNSAGTPQWTREAWPRLDEKDDPNKDPFPVQNQIANPQFTQTFLNPNQTVTYNVTGSNQEFQFAPDWKFVASGTGTITVTREAIAGTGNVVTRPPYVLDITVSAGITDCRLRQKMKVNAGLWTSTTDRQIFLSGHLIAQNKNAGSVGLQLLYSEDSGNSDIAIVDTSVDNSDYFSRSGVTANAIPASTSTNTGANGFVNIDLKIPASSGIKVSSIQVVPVLNAATGAIAQYDEQTSNREQALMGDYFIPALENKPIPSILTAWDFPQNPAQFGLTGTIPVFASSDYIWDQTIAASVTGSTVTYARNSITGGLQFTTTGTNDAFLMLQYLSGAQAKKIIGNKLALKVRAWKTAAGDDVTMRCYLFRGSSGATLPTLPNMIGTFSASGVFTLTQANWTQIARGGLDLPVATLDTVTTNTDLNNDLSYKFNNFEVTDASEIGDTDKFAIIITFAYPDSGTVITVDSVGLCQGDIPSLPAPQTREQVRKECQYYFENTYNYETAAGTTVDTPLSAYQYADTNGGFVRGFATTFNAQFITTKRVVPTVNIYAPSATAAISTVTLILYTDGVARATTDVATTSWTFTRSFNGFYALPDTSTALNTENSVPTTAPQAVILYHYTADARLGKV